MAKTKKRIFTALQLAPITQIIPSSYPSGLREVAENLYMTLKENLPDAGYQLGNEGGLVGDAQQLSLLAKLALAQVDDLSTEMGGHGFYMPKGIGFRLSPRNQTMCAEFRGDYTVLARKYDLTEQQVRNIIDRWQNERYAASQKVLDLPDENQPKRAN